MGGSRFKHWCVGVLAGISGLSTLAQTDSSSQAYAPADSSDVMITAFGAYRREPQVLPSLHLLQGASLDRFNKTSFLPGLNTLPGVRMEERSPGSYRINMRGSSLRSPFGVRNVKVYYNGLPLTDAGGNTYFNQLAFNNITGMEIAKGPAGSMYGAGTGGLILLQSLTPRQTGTEAEIIGGSYGLLHTLAHARWTKAEKNHAAALSYNRQDGYRDHTRMHRANASYSGKWINKENLELTGHILATDLYYQTPGGLTQAEFEADPRQARPRVGALPSAEESKAAIYQQNLMAGLVNKWKMPHQWQNETALYGAYASVRNPSIRNYEDRSEPGWGGRTLFTRTVVKTWYRQQWTTGAEGQWGDFNTRVYTNNQGEKGRPVTNDDLNFFTWNAFTQIQRQYGDRWDVSAGVSYFQQKVSIRRVFPAGNDGLKKDYTNDWAPRLSVLFRPKSGWQLSGLVSRGFSPPTVSELLPSTGIISTGLQPEYGWNYELGVKWQSPDAKWYAGLNFFRFDLQDALVQRRDSTGADFYTNAGETRQQGLEWSGGYLLTRNHSYALQIINIKTAYTYSHFRYTEYRQLNNDFSGNTLPSVPAHTVSLFCDLQWRSSLLIQGTFYSASSIWLNDANTVAADPYQLAGIRAGYGKKIHIYAGTDNLLDQTYSLGNDINAFGGRFFNAAAGRNFYAGVRVKMR